MKDKIEIPLLSKADQEAVFEKIFKNYHIAPVSDEDTYEVKYDEDTKFWMRKRVSRSLVEEEITGHVIDRYVIIWKKRSRRALLVVEAPGSCLLSCGGYDFALRNVSPQGMYTYQYYKYHPKKECYEFIDKGECQPEGLKEPYVSITTHRWTRMWISKPGMLSADNIAFYEYIVKYWSD